MDASYLDKDGDLPEHVYRVLHWYCRRVAQYDDEELYQESLCVALEMLRRGRLIERPNARWIVSMAGYRLGRRDFTRTSRRVDGAPLRYHRADAMAGARTVDVSDHALTSITMHTPTPEVKIDASRIARRMSEDTLAVLLGERGVVETAAANGISHQGQRKRIDREVAAVRASMLAEAA